MSQPSDNRMAIFFFCLSILLISSATLLAGGLVLRALNLEHNYHLLLGGAWLPIGLSIVSFICIRWHSLTDRTVGFVRSPLGLCFAAVIVGLALAPSLGWLASEIRTFIGESLANPQIRQLQLIDGTTLQWLCMAALIVIAVPLTEEVLYRGVLYGFIAERSSPMVAIWVSALVFGFAHYDVANSIGTGLLGLALGWFRAHGGSIWPSVVLHATFNLVGFILIFGSSFT